MSRHTWRWHRRCQRQPAGGILRAAVKLEPRDIVDYQGTAFVVTGVVDFVLADRRVRLACLAAGGDTRFVELSGNPASDRIVLLHALPALDITAPPPAVIYHGGESFLLQYSGAAAVTITGEVGRQPGPCSLWRYRAAGDRYLQIEAWPDGVRMLEGATVHQSMIEVRPLKH